MKKVLLLILICSQLACEFNGQKNRCEYDFTTCQTAWKGAVRNGFVEKLCAYNLYEQNDSQFNFNQYVNFLRLEEDGNDSLLLWLEDLYLNVNRDHNSILVEFPGKAADCLTLRNGPEDCDTLITLTDIPLLECKKMITARERDVWYELSHDSTQIDFHITLFQNKLAYLRYKYYKYLRIKNVYGEPDLIKNHQQKRMTLIKCELNGTGDWDCTKKSSNHRNQDHIEKAIELMHTFLDTSTIVKSFGIKNIEWPLYYYEKDQVE